MTKDKRPPHIGNTVLDAVFILFVSLVAIIGALMWLR